MTSDRDALRREFSDSWHWIRIARRMNSRLMNKEAHALFELTRNRAPQRDAVVVALGQRLGPISVLLAAGMRDKQNPRLFCVDAFGAEQSPARQERDFTPASSAAQQGLEGTFCRNIRRCGLSGIVQTVKGRSFEAVRSWAEPIDILLINGGQEEEAVRDDVTEWAPFLKIGGTIALHNVSPLWPGQSTLMAENPQPPYFDDLDHAASLSWAVKRSASPFDRAPQTRIAMHEDGFERWQREIARLLAVLKYLADEEKGISAGLLASEGVREAISGELRAARAAVSSANRAISELLQTKDQLLSELRDSAGSLAEARHAEAALRGSWSWRLTALLRLMVECLRLLRGCRIWALQRTTFAGIIQWLLWRKRVSESGLFDRAYYLKQNLDVASLQIDPLIHYFLFGSVEGRNPHYLFDVSYYLASNPDLAHSYVNPLVHYLKRGAFEGRNPHPHFDTRFYLEQNPDVRTAGVNPLAHFLATGIAEGRDPTASFDTSEYLDQHPNVADQAMNPLIHCLEQKGGRSGTTPCSRF
jgi:hypothetical protein